MHDHAGDDELLGIFRRLGVDLDKEREVNFFFLFPDEASAERAKKLLADRNYDADLSELVVPFWKRLFAKPKWSVLVQQMIPLDEAKIKGMTTHFQQIAMQCGGNYDGWEASVAGDNINADQLEQL